MHHADKTLELFFLVLGAVFPAVFLMIRTWLYDKYEPEPKAVVAATLLVGLALPLLCYWPEALVSNIIDLFNFRHTTHGLLDAFLVAGFIEEGAKFAVFLTLIYRNDNFNEPFDGIIYSIAISLGFAGCENIIYVVVTWFSDASIAWTVVQSRTLMAVPQHALCGLFMGYYFGRARFTDDRTQRRFLILLAFVVPFLLHGLYDAFLELLGNAGTLACLGLLAIEYMVGSSCAKKLLNDSPFFTVSKMRMAQHIRHHHVPAVPTIPRSGWPWEK